MATPTNLPAAFVSGAILTAEQMNNLRGAFRIMQVVRGQTSTAVGSTSASLATTGLTATITPQSTSSLILGFCTLAGCKTAAITTGIELAWLRGATNIQTFAKFLGYNTSSIDTSLVASGMILDTPATTSPATYTIHFARSTGSGTVEVQAGSNATSTMILMEVSA